MSIEEKADKKRELLRKVSELKASGLGTMEALKEVGLAKSQYYIWSKEPKAKRAYKKRAKKAFVQDIPIHTSQERVMCIIGTSSEIADIIRGIK